MSISTENKSGNKPDTDKPDKALIGNLETSVNTVQTAKIQKTRGEVPTIEELTVEQVKDAYYHEPATQVGINGSEVYGDHNGLPVQPSKIDVCKQKVVPLSLRDHRHHADHCSPSIGDT